MWIAIDFNKCNVVISINLSAITNPMNLECYSKLDIRCKWDWVVMLKITLFFKWNSFVSIQFSIIPRRGLYWTNWWKNRDKTLCRTVFNLSVWACQQFNECFVNTWQRELLYKLAFMQLWNRRVKYEWRDVNRTFLCVCALTHVLCFMFTW